ncbi:MAG: CBS domain-containing protein [Flavobacterium sp.]|nr:CBS domain-containing protein [Pedobacter sp.]
MNNIRAILNQKSKSIISINPENTVYDALKLMVDENVGAILVMNSEIFVGIFTERDYARKVILRGKASKETRVHEIMTPDPVTINPDFSIEDCMRLMTDRFIRHLPVIENGKLIGVISIGDLVKSIMEEQQFIIDNLQHYISGT